MFWLLQWQYDTCLIDASKNLVIVDLDNNFFEARHYVHKCCSSLKKKAWDKTQKSFRSCNLKLVIFKIISRIDNLSIYREIALKYMAQNLTVD